MYECVIKMASKILNYAYCLPDARWQSLGATTNQKCSIRNVKWHFWVALTQDLLPVPEITEDPLWLLSLLVLPLVLLRPNQTGDKAAQLQQITHKRSRRHRRINAIINIDIGIGFGISGSSSASASRATLRATLTLTLTLTLRYSCAYFAH